MIYLNVLYIKEIKIFPAYISKINTNSEKRIMQKLLMQKRKDDTILWEKISALLHGTTSKHNADIYNLTCLHSFRKENKLKSFEKVQKTICGIVIPSQDDNILQFNQ